MKPLPNRTRDWVRRMSLSFFLLTSGSWLLAPLLAACGPSDADGIRDTARRFYQAYNESRYEDLLTLTARATREKDPDAFYGAMALLRSRTQEVRLENVGDPRIEGNQATLPVRANDAFGTADLALSLVKEDGRWLMQIDTEQTTRFLPGPVVPTPTPRPAPGSPPTPFRLPPTPRP